MEGRMTTTKTCKLCGEPVWPNRSGLLRCETHYHAYFAGAQRRRYWRIKRARMAAAVAKLTKGAA
jgi:hypothetical protein